MKGSLATLAFVASALANPMPQAVTSAVAPEASTPAGCSDSRDGEFQITVVNVTSSSAKRGVEKRQGGILECSLADGVLKDQDGRTAYIASNYQFQFDSPPQAGAIYTAGFSVCENNTLALGGSAIFYQCFSVDKYNLYDRNWGEHCNAVYIYAQGGSGGGAPPATQSPDGQPAVPTNPVSQSPDGQPIAPTGAPVSQSPDGQPIAPTGAPVSQSPDGQPIAPTGAPVSQSPDGQPIAPTGAPVSQSPDGQPIAPTGAPVSQSPDGQPIAPTGAPVSQSPDGQPVAPTGVPVSQSPDGQPIAPTEPANPVVPGNATVTTGGLPEFTGAAATPVYGLGALAAGAMGVLALL